MSDLFSKPDIESSKTPEKPDVDEEARRRDISTARVLRMLNEGGVQQLRFSGSGIRVRGRG